MEAITAWVGAHALPLLLGLLLLGAVGALVQWRGRPAWSDDVPLPLLHHRTALWLLLLALAAFVAIALGVGAQRRLVAFDQRVTSSVAEWLGSDALRGLSWLTELGDTDVLGVLAVLVALALLLTRHWLLGASWVLTVLGSAFVINLFKYAFQRPRPLHEHGFAQESTWSFPSGHAAGAMVFYGMLGYVLMVRLPQRWHRLLSVLMVAVIALVGASRVLLQVHYLSDVAAGFAVGLGWLALWIAATEFVRTAHRPRPAPPPADPAKR